MVATVRCYYNTGLTPSNCLDGSYLLAELGFEYRDFPNIAIKQDRGLITIKLNTIYDNIKDADYCKINDNCYWITNIVMLNDNVAEIKLQQDCLTTIGIYPLFKLDIVSGWCTRRHVLDDDIYTNILDEPFNPTNEPVIDTGTVISGSDDTGFYAVILSTVDLLNIKDTATAYFDKDSDKILVPDLPNVIGTNTTYTSHLVDPAKTAYIALSNAFNAANADVQQGMKSVRQLGIESCIGAAYMLPKAWATITDNNGLITSIVDKSRDETSALSTKWDPDKYKNNKVYSGQFQKIMLFSLASGDSVENRIEDIINPETNNIVYATYADTRYSGKPGCKPKYYKSHLNSALMQSVHGAPWQQTPFVYNISSGFGFIGEDYAFNRSKQALNQVNSQLGSILSSALGGTEALFSVVDSAYEDHHIGRFGRNLTGPISNIVTNAFNSATSAGNYFVDRMRIRAETNRALLSNDIKFPQVPNMADYVGNAFYDLRIRLNDNDMQRFDNFLTAYGYAVDEELKSECFSGRENFNFVQAKDVSLKIPNFPQYLIDGMAKQIEAGVRIWHKAPSNSALLDNPIIGGQ